MKPRIQPTAVKQAHEHGDPPALPSLGARLRRLRQLQRARQDTVARLSLHLVSDLDHALLAASGPRPCWCEEADPAPLSVALSGPHVHA